MNFKECFLKFLGLYTFLLTYVCTKKVLRKLFAHFPKDETATEKPRQMSLNLWMAGFMCLYLTVHLQEFFLPIGFLLKSTLVGDF